MKQMKRKQSSNKAAAIIPTPSKMKEVKTSSKSKNLIVNKDLKTTALSKQQQQQQLS